MSVEIEDNAEKELERKNTAQAKFNVKGWLTSVLRRASFRWGPRSESLKRARIERGLYRCNMCKGEFKNKEIIVDHIEPVVPLDGFPLLENQKPDWNIFIDRLFCDVDGFQIICKNCSDAKTSIEDTIRAERNRIRKLKLKEEKKNVSVSKRSNNKSS